MDCDHTVTTCIFLYSISTLLSCLLSWIFVRNTFYWLHCRSAYILCMSQIVLDLFCSSFLIYCWRLSHSVSWNHLFRMLCTSPVHPNDIYSQLSLMPLGRVCLVLDLSHKAWQRAPWHFSRSSFATDYCCSQRAQTRYSKMSETLWTGKYLCVSVSITETGPKGRMLISSCL